MKKRPEVECWCCEYFTLEENNLLGTCAYKQMTVPAHDKVCDEFILLSGLSKTRTIPYYCKNYK